MRFADEVVPRSDVEGVPDRRTKPDAKALTLATQIVDSLESDWKPEQYHDTYAEELRKRIKAKDEGKEVVEEHAPAEKADVLDLMEALERSVNEAKRGRSRSGKGSTKKAPASKAAASKRSSSRARKSA
jgi:DNA end-binding protein Ku